MNGENIFQLIFFICFKDKEKGKNFNQFLFVWFENLKEEKIENKRAKIPSFTFAYPLSVCLVVLT